MPRFKSRARGTGPTHYAGLDLDLNLDTFLWKSFFKNLVFEKVLKVERDCPSGNPRQGKARAPHKLCERVREVAWRRWP